MTKEDDSPPAPGDVGWTTYGTPPPGIYLGGLTGKLIVVEGPDAVGRSTQITMLKGWLEAEGHAVTTAGLSRSSLAGPELEEAKAGHLLRPRTMALFYAADLFDQIENTMLPALRAGAVVLADRYVPSLLARAMARGLDPGWLATVYGPALVPDRVFYLQASPKRLVERMLHKYGRLDFWEAGMDLGLSADWHESFLRYQRRVAHLLAGFRETYPFEAINANRSALVVQKELRHRIKKILDATA